MAEKVLKTTVSDIKEIMPFNGYITKGIYLNEQLKVVLKNSGYFYCGIMKDKNELSKLKNSVIEQKNRI